MSALSGRKIKKLIGLTGTAAQYNVLSGVTAGTAAASKALVLDSSKGIATITSATITTLTSTTGNFTNIDAGASGTAGSVDIFPTTASKGKIALTCTANTNNDTLTITNAAHGQATTLTIPDGGQATASFVLTEGTQTINGTKTIAALNTTNLDAGASGTAGTVDIFPTTASKGKLILSCDDQTGNTSVTLKPAAMGQATVLSIQDPGATTANILTSSGIGATFAARCTSAFSATSGDTGTTLTAVTGMTVNVLAAGVYAFRVYIPGTGTANSGGKFAISGTATMTSINYTGQQFNDGTCNDTTTTTTLGNEVGAATAAWNAAYIEGTCVVNAAGTMILQAAQNASHADATTVSVNASMVFTRIA